MTKKIYLEDTYQFYCEAFIQEAGKDEKGLFIILDQTIFYPQGGGQPSDQGTVKNNCFKADVIHVVQRDDGIRHYITSEAEAIPVGSKIECLIDQGRRIINARYHTAGHLLGNIVEILHPTLKAHKGHSFPGEAYVEFQGDDDTINSTALQKAIDDAIIRNDKTRIFEMAPDTFEAQFYKLPYRIPENKKFRAMQIGDMPPVPCGGTHLTSMGEIGSMGISKIKIKNNCVHISYGVI
jgi:alanyl-tRNA synthetase